MHIMVVFTFVYKTAAPILVCFAIKMFEDTKDEIAQRNSILLFIILYDDMN